MLPTFDTQQVQYGILVLLQNGATPYLKISMNPYVGADDDVVTREGPTLKQIATLKDVPDGTHVYRPTH
jgi:hypothetical protein